jgi:hypothetical protein
MANCNTLVFHPEVKTEQVFQHPEYAEYEYNLIQLLENDKSLKVNDGIVKVDWQFLSNK